MPRRRITREYHITAPNPQEQQNRARARLDDAPRVHWKSAQIAPRHGPRVCYQRHRGGFTKASRRRMRPGGTPVMAAQPVLLRSGL